MSAVGDRQAVGINTLLSKKYHQYFLLDLCTFDFNSIILFSTLRLVVSCTAVLQRCF